MIEKAKTSFHILVALTMIGAAASLAFAQPAAMSAGSRIFIDGDSDFAIYLTAAIREKHVNVLVTTDKTKADYILEQTSDHIKKTGLKPSIVADWTAPVVPQSVKSYDAASVRLVNAKTSDVVFAYSVDRNNTAHGRQTAAESCAKHLKAAIALGLNPNSSHSQGPTVADKMAAWPWHADPAMPGIY